MGSANNFIPHTHEIHAPALVDIYTKKQHIYISLYYISNVYMFNLKM